MKTLILRIEYDGTNYSGWQRQLNNISIQESLEKTLLKITGKKYNIIGAGRTDAGVHARGQICSINLDEEFSIPINKISKALNSNLPDDIFINGVFISDEIINARKNAIGREYSYSVTRKKSVFTNRFSSLITYPMNFDLLLESSKLFIGKHDFTSFSKINESTKNYVCDISKSEWERVDEYNWIYHVQADRFVYGMVRALVGAMIDVSRGKKSLDNILFSINNPSRINISPIAAAKGLVFEKVYFSYNIKFID